MTDIRDVCALCGQPIGDDEGEFEDAETGKLYHLTCAQVEANAHEDFGEESSDD